MAEEVKTNTEVEPQNKQEQGVQDPAPKADNQQVEEDQSWMQIPAIMQFFIFNEDQNVSSR